MTLVDERWRDVERQRERLEKETSNMLRISKLLNLHEEELKEIESFMDYTEELFDTEKETDTEKFYNADIQIRFGDKTLNYWMGPCFYDQTMYLLEKIHNEFVREILPNHTDEN